MEATQLIDGRWPWVFQVDSEIVKQIYAQRENYLIEYDETATSKDTCAIYFSSNNIYFPNEENVFRKRIVERNAFEWYGMRIKRAYKHIFIRDVFKQWYLLGINDRINTPEALLAFLKQETIGMKIITLGSSAGGYAAILYGTQLKAEQVLAFNPQFEIGSLLPKTDAAKNPVLFRLQDTEWIKFFDLKAICDFSDTNIYYFHSAKSPWDNEQWEHVKGCQDIHHLAFWTAHHGIPFLKVALPEVLNLDWSQLSSLEKKTHHPLLFAIRQAGLIQVICGVAKQIFERYTRRK